LWLSTHLPIISCNDRYVNSVPGRVTDVVFVHGALVRDGQWWWQPTADFLREQMDMRSHAVLLPSVGEAQAAEGLEGLAADAHALRRALDRHRDRSVVLVGHSYGGTVIAEAGSHPAVDRIVLISSYLPVLGSAQVDLMKDEPDAVAVEPASDNAVQLAGYTSRTFAARFLHDVPETLHAAAWERAAPQQLSALVTPTSNTGWDAVESTYIVCADDRSTSVQLQQRHAARATRSVELPTGHHPFLSRPDLVAREVAGAEAVPSD
jgi:pimeloyl-ACP methyl ester carboxylesterase